MTHSSHDFYDASVPQRRIPIFYDSMTVRRTSCLIDRLRVFIVANKHGNYFRIPAALKNELIQGPPVSIPGTTRRSEHDAGCPFQPLNSSLSPSSSLLHVLSPQVTLGRRVYVASRPRAISPNLDSSCSSDGVTKSLLTKS